jgi:hypothetical protein
VTTFGRRHQRRDVGNRGHRAPPTQAPEEYVGSRKHGMAVTRMSLPIAGVPSRCCPSTYVLDIAINPCGS